MKPVALIPVYDNAGTIADVVTRCRGVMEPDVMVVADGSRDGSDVLARDAGAKVVRLPENQGKGSAIVKGLAEARKRGYSHAVVVDADGQHLPEEIPRLLDAAWDEPERIWVGVRRMEGESIPPSSLRGRSISNFWATLNGWQRCRDTQSGFRVYPVEETLELGCREHGFAFEMEVLVRAAWAGMRVGHVPVEVHYQEGDERVTHFDMKRDNLAFSWLSFKMFWGMLARSPLLLWRKINYG
ncbi:MAG: glycosyltransferase family 2 protein [Deltaproteobacteria bacterium]|nr:glycosyltransferase family 2 protein [Deltaproteobacteria bacterium]